MPRKKLVRAGFTFFPNDWLSDTGLNACSLGARGLWIEMLARMFKSPKRGYLLMPNGDAIDKDRLAILSHATEADVAVYLEELKGASIFSQTCTGTIYCRKMLRDIKEREEWRKRKSGQYDREKRITRESPENHALPIPLHSIPIKTKEKATTAQAPLPEWCPPEVWNDFRLMRQKIRKPMTSRAELLILQKVDALRQLGQDPKAVLEQSICNSWQGVFPLKELENGNGKGPHEEVGRRQREADRASAEAIRRMG